MRVTVRDRKLLEDIALHQVMTREQIVHLGYFSSVQRANARLLDLRKAGLLRLVELNPALETRRYLYAVASGARSLLDPRVATLLRSRSLRPRHIEHSLAAVNVRIELQRLGGKVWHSEPQTRHLYEVTTGARKLAKDFRPDGLVWFQDLALFVEVDMGQVSLPRFKEKLQSYSDYVKLGVFASTYGKALPRLLIVTTGELRKRHILRCLDSAKPVATVVETFKGLTQIQSWNFVAQ